MANLRHTPEALLGRNDSKNPATTCKAITSSGRPCRRAVVAAKSSQTMQRKTNAPRLSGVVALLQEGDEEQEADLYCWQHKDQAQERVSDTKEGYGKGGRRRAAELRTLQERSSIDTLVQRLGIDVASENGGSPKTNGKTRTPDLKPPRRMERRNEETPELLSARMHGFPGPSNVQHKSKSSSFWASLCCMSCESDDYVEIVRHRKRVEQIERPPNIMSHRHTKQSVSRPSPPIRSERASVTTQDTVGATPPVRPSFNQRTASNLRTDRLLSLIPQHLSPQTTSAVLAELIKPTSPTDGDGYIYIFWLTPQSNMPPSQSTAQSLLATSHPGHNRRISDIMTEYSFDGNEETARSQSDIGGKKSILLKIGRASNVTRRMNEWQRQCGYMLNLVRWYPYMPSTPAPTQSSCSSPQAPSALYPDLSIPLSQGTQRDGVRKVGRVKRVERLIHLELAEKQIKRHCEACGKEHREWFEVEASRTGIREVDKTVKRWIAWAETVAEG